MLFYLQHLRSAAASALGDHGTASAGSGKVLKLSAAMALACTCDTFLSQALPILLDMACGWIRASLVHYVCNLCVPGTMCWPTAVALASDHALLAASFFSGLQLEYPFEGARVALIRLAVAHVTWVSIILDRHAPKVWQCRVVTMCLMLFFSSESVLSMTLGAIGGWWNPAFPPKLSAEDIEEKLSAFRAFVEANVDLLRARTGNSILAKLRSGTGASAEEKQWYFFLQRNRKNFRASHDELLDEMYGLVTSIGAPPVAPADSEPLAPDGTSLKTSLNMYKTSLKHP